MAVCVDDLFSSVDITMIHRGFLDRVCSMLAACRAAGHDYRATSGYRSARAQYARERLRPREVVIGPRAFQSAHHYGLALDFTCGRDDPAAYEVLGREARSHGLVWGGDGPMKTYRHVQAPGPAPLEGLMRVYLAAAEQDWFSRNCELTGLKAVWASLDEGASIHA